MGTRRGAKGCAASSVPELQRPAAQPCTSEPAAAPVATPWLALELAGPIDPLPQRPRDRGRVEPLSPARYRVEFTAGAELKAKLGLARDLMSHSNPNGDFAPIIERALDLVIAELQKEAVRGGEAAEAGAERRARTHHQRSSP